MVGATVVVVVGVVVVEQIVTELAFLARGSWRSTLGQIVVEVVGAVVVSGTVVVVVEVVVVVVVDVDGVVVLGGTVVEVVVVDVDGVVVVCGTVTTVVDVPCSALAIDGSEVIMATPSRRAVPESAMRTARGEVGAFLIATDGAEAY